MSGDLINVRRSKFGITSDAITTIGGHYFRFLYGIYLTNYNYE